jgi:hypothetical protein
MGGKTTRTEETKVGTIQLNNATYGLVVSLVLGTSKISGNVIDYYDFTAVSHEETTSTGKGGGKTVNTTYTYTAAVLFGLAEGPGSVGKVWNDDGETSLSALNLTLFTGEYGQSPWSYTQSKHPVKALPYSGLIYAAGVMDLSSSGSVPQLNFEVKGLLRDTGDGIDVNPADAIAFICTDSLNGVGFGVGGIDSDSLERYKTYCKAADLYITVSLTETKKAYELINEICEATNTIVFWSQNKLKLVPKCDEKITGNGVTYTPDLTPLYDLTEDDFIDDDQLVSFERVDNAETYNDIPVEFTNRSNSYETETVNGEILANINKRGRRTSSTKNYTFLHTKARAQYVADLLVKASVYARNTYTFKLGWSHCMLEPGDYVTIYDPVISPNPIPVLIDEIEEDEDGELTITAIKRTIGVSSAARYTVYEAERAAKDYNVAPGNVNEPVIFDAPAAATTSGLETWIAVCGGVNWGGCYIWASDDGNSYKQIGKISGPSRTGTLTAELSASGDSLEIELDNANLQLLSGTAQDAANLNTLCWIDGEMITYTTATLTDTGKYTLIGLVRGAYGTTAASHLTGSRFARLSDNVFKYAYSKDDFGESIYLKYVSFNIFESALQSISDVEAYTHIITGSAVPDITGLYPSLESSLLKLIWDPIVDTRKINYEIRLDIDGTWDNAEKLVQTSSNSYTITNNGAYWVAGYFYGLYSDNPVNIAIDQLTITTNVIAKYDEKGTGWSGIFENTAITNEDVLLTSSLPIDDLDYLGNIDDIKGYWDLLGLVAGTVGNYTIPEAHVIDIGTKAPCTVNFDATFNTPDGTSAKTQINVSDDDGVYSGWIDITASGQAYIGRLFNFRIVLSTDLDAVSPSCTSFNFSVDVPDVTDRGINNTVPVTGLDIIFNRTFHDVPAIIPAINAAQSGDEIIKSNETRTGFHIDILNNEVMVERSISWIAQGY